MPYCKHKTECFDFKPNVINCLTNSDEDRDCLNTDRRINNNVKQHYPDRRRVESKVDKKQG